MNSPSEVAIGSIEAGLENTRGDVRETTRPLKMGLELRADMNSLCRRQAPQKMFGMWETIKIRYSRISFVYKSRLCVQT